MNLTIFMIYLYSFITSNISNFYRGEQNEKILYSILLVISGFMLLIGFGSIRTRDRIYGRNFINYFLNIIFIQFI